MSRRIIFGKHVFIPTGKPVQIGSPSSRRFGGIDKYGVSRKITIVVGQNKGKQPKNTSKSCARIPKKFSVRAVDDAFLHARELQVGKRVEGTRVTGRGWYKNDPEPSVSYDVSYVPPKSGGPASEPTYEVFKENMNRLAERLAEVFCQDSVLIVRDNGKQRSVAAATWDPPRRVPSKRKGR